MDKNKKVGRPRLENPKAAEVYNDVDKRREYQRDWARKKKDTPKIKIEEIFDEENEEIENQTQTVGNTHAPSEPRGDLAAGGILGAVEMLVNELPADDPLKKTVNKYSPYIKRYGPLVMQGVKGFVERMQEAQAAQAGMQKAPAGPQPPEGWLAMSPLQKWKNKYGPDGSLTSWYRQGEIYDEWKSQNSFNQNIINAQRVNMPTTYAGQINHYEKSQKEAIERRKGNMQNSNEQIVVPNMSMKDFERQANDFGTQPQSATQEGESVQEAMKRAEEERLKRLAEENGGAEEQLQEVLNVVQEDNRKYLAFFENYLQTRTIEDFEKDLENLDATLEKYKPLLGLLPVQTRTLIKSMSDEDLEVLVKRNDPLKINLVEKKELRPKLKGLLDGLKAMM